MDFEARGEGVCVCVYTCTHVCTRACGCMCVTVLMHVKQCNVYVYACVSVRGGQRVNKNENVRPLLWKKREK